MPNFRKRPVVVEAHQFNGTLDCAVAICEWSDHAAYIHRHWDRMGQELLKITLGIATLEGEMEAEAGSWIIRGVNGEYYPCKPDIFEKTYEPVE